MESPSLLNLIERAVAEQWEELDLSGMNLSKLPPEIGNLKQLKRLILGKWDEKKLERAGNQLATLPEELWQLRKLEELNLSYNKINALSELIGQLINLNVLDLSTNKISILPESIGQLINLTTLELWSNKISILPESISQLINLTHLSLSFNQINILPESISSLTKLTYLGLSFNQINVLPESISQLTKLTYLGLNSNQINVLPKWIGQLTSLTSLELWSNNLNALPESVGQLTNLDELIINENPLIQIPSEVVKKGGIAVRDYYRQRLEAKTDYIYEAKLLIVGEGGAGKTSLANKLIDSKYKLKPENCDNPERSTEGIDVHHFDFPHFSGKSFRINIWDFGGQEIYHATHQFFLTKRSLYILVADTRQDNTDFNYWLEIVELLSESSPVIIVKNEKQDRLCQVNENQLRGRFRNLEKILPTNLSSNRGLPEILLAIQHHISQLPHIGQPLPKTWVQVRKTLETDTRNYITQEEFLLLCGAHGFKRRKDILQLSGYFHDLGICLHFQDDPILKNWVILKPEWGNIAFYSVIDNPKIQQDLGCFTHEELAKIWTEDSYIDMHDELLQMMMRFKLCYEIPHRPRTYIAPQLLSPNQPEYAWDETNNLILRYHYDFMPKGMLTRFIVEMHRLIDGDLVWKEGAILIDRNACAAVIEKYPKNEIHIRISGAIKKPLREAIRHEFRKIHDSYEKLRYQEFIPCICSNCKGSSNPFSYSLDRLEERLRKQRQQIECDISYEMVNVRDMIDDAIGSGGNTESVKPPNINVSGDWIEGDKIGQDKIEGDKIKK